MIRRPPRSTLFPYTTLFRSGVPVAASLAIARPPCVVKADGLAAGKGVVICHTQAELDAGLATLTALGGPLVIEELLEGEEVSLFALCDGQHAVPLVPARDYKRAYDGDEGPNTGGMGAFAPVPGLGRSEIEALVGLVHRPVLAELARRGTPFVGLLYAGLMITESGPKVLEFNCRFGDPETQAVLPLVEGDLLEALAAAAGGELAGASLEIADGAAVTVVVAAGDYPSSGDRGTPIEGVAEAEATGALVFHAGTALRDGELVTNGGRVLAVTGRGDTFDAARSAAYAAVDMITFAGARHRTDIAAGVEAPTPPAGAGS